MKPASYISELADKLNSIKRRNLATQKVIEVATGVDQTTISRLLNGKRRRVTRTMQRVDRYANMLLGEDVLPEGVRRAARDFLTHGGTEAELVATIEHSARLIMRKLT